MSASRPGLALVPVLVMVLGLTLSAETAETAETAVAQTQSMPWLLDKTHSQLEFSGTQTGSGFTGTFSRYEAHIDFDPAQPQTGHIDLTVDLGSARTGDTQRDTALPGKDWFDIASFPKAHFVSTAIRRTGANTYQADGSLTLRNVSRPVRLDFMLSVDGQTAHAKGHADLMRTQFGVGQGPWASGQWVGLPVVVTFDFMARRAG